MKQMIFVFAGGGIGAVLRYTVTGLVYKSIDSSFPFGTFIVNVLGCLLIGFLMTMFEDRFLMQPTMKLFITIGILGGFTTFSTFSFETMQIWLTGEITATILNAFGTLAACLAATWLGSILGKII